MSATNAADHHVPAASVQERMWFAERLEPGDGLYNMPFAWRVHGTLSADALERAIAVVVERHEILRTAFAERDGRLYQHVGEPWTPGIERLDLRGAPDAEDRLSDWLREAARRTFDLAQARLLRVGLADLDDNQQVLFLCVHHIVWDATSTRLFLRELKDCYDAFAVEAGPPAETVWVEQALPLPAQFLGQAARTPGKTALVFDGTSLTYAELGRRARAVAGFLTGRGLGRGDLVGVYLDRSADLVPTLLGVLLSGAAYVPLDPIYPPQRIAGMLEDAQVGLLIAGGELPAEITATGVEAAGIDTVLAAAPIADGAAVTGDDIAYVIYTSGSTGRPKGVRVTHRGLANLLRSMAVKPGFGDQDTMLALTTVCFDIAALELFLPLITGGTVEVAPAEITRDGELLGRHLARTRPTHLQATPATWRMLLAAGWPGDPELTVLCGGEALPRALADELLPRGRVVWNLYGPTETTIWSTAGRVTAGPITLGEPVTNTTLNILDEAMRPVPPGEPGELWIGGDGVAAGYLRRPELTAERFRPDPADPARGVLYRTGDLVRLLPGGQLEYVNRVDNQIKLHGFRIEPGEIESLLRGRPEIADAVVLLDGDKLAAYLDCAGPPPSVASLRAFLGSHLPEYMIPAAFLVVEEFPLTGNGKVDRRALAELGGQLPAGPRAEPATPTERLLTGIFADVLGCPEPGVDDSFLELGGHSLMLAQLAGEIAARTGITLSVADVYQLSRPRELAAHLDFLAGTAAEGPAEPAPAGTPASSMQEQMWLAEQMVAAGPSYNVPLTWRITGELDPAALQAALGGLTERHEILRSAFRQRHGRLLQVVTDPWVPELVRTDLADRPEADAGAVIDALVDTEASTPFDLGAGRPVRAHLVTLAPGEHVLLLCLHHIVFDAQSLPVLQRDLDHAYRRALGLPAEDLPAPVQFAEVTQRQREELETADGEDILGYWTERLAGAPETLDLGTLPRQSGPHGAVPVPFSPDFAARAAELCDEHRVSWYMVAVAAVSAWLHRSANSDDITFGLPVANREDEDLEDVLGPCLNTVVLRSQATSGTTFAELLGEVRDAMLDAFEFQAAPLPAVLTRLDPQRRHGHTPFLDVMLNLVTGEATGHALGPATMTPRPFDRWEHETKFGLTVTFVEEGGKLSAVLSYRGDRHSAARVQRLADGLGRVLDGIGGLAGRPLAEILPPGRAQFRDFALSQADERASAAGKAALDRWTNRLAGAPAFPALTPPLRQAQPGSVPIPLSPAALQQLRRLRAEQRMSCSWFMVAATALAALLHRWTGQDEVTFGFPVANRDEFPDLLGPCLNTVVLRSECDDETTVLDLLHTVRETALAAFDDQRVPFEDVVDGLRPPRRPGWTPYADVTLAATAVGRVRTELGGAALTPLELDHTGAGYAAKLGLTVGFEESHGRLHGTILYRGDRITDGEAHRMAAWIGRFVDAFAEIVHQPVRTLDLLGADQLAELAGFERTAPAGEATSVPALFAAQCAARPDAPAIRTARGVLSYAALDRKADALASVLRARATGDRPVVALVLPRGADLVVAMLAAWKAGFVYSPLDPAYPEGRIRFILEDLGACAVVTDSPADLAGTVPPGTAVVDVGKVPDVTARPQAELPSPDSTAYVLYTSGTTGEPKGVAYSHGSLAHVTRWHVDTFGVQPGDRVSQIHSVAFDMTEYEVWPALCGGAELLPYERPVVVPELLAWLGDQDVTMFFTPTPLAEALWTAGTAPASLRWLFFAGSPLTSVPPETPYGVCDAYGPTETYITTTHVLDVATATALNCVGRPIDGVHAYVLDPAGQRCPAGMPGELFVGGATVSQGYWGRDDLTRERFTDRDPDGRPGWLYRTGDRARWLPDGTLEYLGRLDRQLKIRGYRIEPAEIETQLLLDPLVRQAVVRGFPGDAAALVAYLVAPPGGAEDTQSVLAGLKTRLPEFMVPNAVVWLPALPLNHRGKLDVDALPAPGREDRVGATAWTAPEAGTEQRIAAVWSAVLGLEAVGAHDNFFDLGGNSLLLGALHSRLERELSITLPIRRLFEHPTVHALARALAAGPAPQESTVDVRGRAERARARRARPGRPEKMGDAA
ncbi:non-ribosomal peptide synthetase [Amycolatopsis sp. CA-128772]|uniref:non-ribosomal peptide synthetase n=1 Tax=Amycolatopsis sp. CA-128772 TaxID=2073159 RepID=UPI000CD0B7C5|nr:non-ribosomal peptide synthetase [Amycolatopsis sp. CA-128772]